MTIKQRYNRAKWALKLIFSKLKQTQGNLYRKHEDSYCCLGVLCRMGDPLNKLMWEGGGTILYNVGRRELGYAAGLSDNEEDELVKMNDSQNKSFKEIGKVLLKSAIFNTRVA